MTVIVPNLPMRYDVATQEHVPTRNINKAADFGPLRILTRGDQDVADVLATQDLVPEDPEDDILCIGSIGILSCAIARTILRHGRANLLVWDPSTHNYEEITIYE